MVRHPRRSPETIAATRAAAIAKGVPPIAASAFVAATSQDRHRARAKAFIDAAHDEFLRVTGHDTIASHTHEAHGYAIAMLVLDAFGLVADSGPTPETTKIHHRAFRTGCGPRVGPIAAATHAAAKQAVDSLYAALFALEYAALPQPKRGCPFIMITPSTSPMGISIKPSACAPVMLHIEPTEAQNSQAPGWLRTLALEGLRRAMGSAPWFELRDERKPWPGESRPSASIFDLVIFDGSAGEWGCVLEAILERERVDKVAQQITHAIAETTKHEPLFWLPPWKPLPKRRVSLDYIERWLAMALGDELSRPVIDVVQSGTAGAIGAIWSGITKPELEWMARIERTAAMMTPLSPMSGADWSRHWLSFSALMMIASAIGSGSDAQLGYAERAVRSLHQFGTPVLSPEPSLGLQFDECEGVVLMDAVSPAAKFAARQYGQGIVCRVIELLTKRPAGAAPVEHLCGARIIGTLPEWQAVAASMMTGIGHGM